MNWFKKIIRIVLLFIFLAIAIEELARYFRGGAPYYEVVGLLSAAAFVLILELF